MIPNVRQQRHAEYHMLPEPRKAEAMDITEHVFNKAIGVLKQNSTELGIKASDTKYNHVWSRDSFITFLGSNMLKDPVLLEAAKNTLLTLGRSASELGMIPVRYDLDGDRPRWFFAGAVDASTWYIIGLANLYHVTSDRSLLGETLNYAINAYRWLRYQDANNELLIDSQPAADWKDNTVTRSGKVMYNNILFLMATRCIKNLCRVAGKKMPKNLDIDYDFLKKRFEDKFAPDDVLLKSGKWPNLADHDKDYITDGPKTKSGYYLSFITFNHADTHFDTFGNLLCILGGVSNPSTSKSIMYYIESNKLDDPYPISVLHPIYRYGKNMHYDKAYTKIKPPYWRNGPYSYHNGGIWPFVGGFHVIAKKKLGYADTLQELESLAKANALVRKNGEKGFNEWLHGKTGKPKGQDGQSWNAGMYIAAYLYVVKGQDPFGFLEDWPQPAVSGAE